MKTIICSLAIFSLLFSLTADLAKAAEMSQQSFWKKVDRDLQKQSKEIHRNAKKKSLSNLNLKIEQFKQQNRLAKKYNVADSSSIKDIFNREEYIYYASTPYKESFKSNILEKAKSFKDFESYIATTGESKEARGCRIKRAIFLGSGVGLASAALAGGILTAMLIPNLIAAVAITIRPISIVFLALLGGGIPGSAIAFKLHSKLKCPAE